MSNQLPTVHLHRVFRAPPERVYRAFLDPSAMERWLPPYGFLGKVHEADIRVGGGYRMSFTNFGTGSSHFFGGEYIELVEPSLIRYTDQFENPAMPEVMSVTVTLKAVTAGTELHVTQSNLPPSIPLDYCYLGWQESLAQLAALVDPEIPDGP